MIIRNFAALAVAAAVVAALAAQPAEAAKRKRAALNRPSQVIVIGNRAPTRITVRRRSFLDPGTESKTFAQHYHDYAVGPSYSVFPIFFDHSVSPGSFSRQPLPGLWDVPGYTRF